MTVESKVASMAISTVEKMAATDCWLAYLWAAPKAVQSGHTMVVK